MTQIASDESVRADFQNVVLTNNDTRFVLTQKNNEFWVRMEKFAEAKPGGDRPALDVRMGLVTGSHHMQVFWLPGGQGNVQVGFPFTWLVPEKRWVPRNATFIRPPDTVHRSEVWNVICSRCHATAIEPRVDSAAHIIDTRAAELGISCEACHGPGQYHVKQRTSERDSVTPVSASILRSELVHPKKIDPVRAAQICGFCHSMKWIDKSEPWLQDGFRFRPGDDLEATTPVIRPARVNSVPALADYLSHNPELLDDFFWPDGMIRVSGREYNGLIESPCYKGGQFSCLSCHSLHKSDPDDQLAQGREGNRACTQCHETLSDETRLAAHTHHKASSSGSECYNCHMPHTTYGVLTAIRSHQISSPRVADELATGRPNACNLCHLDKTLGWTAGRLSQWWNQTPLKLPNEENEISHGVRLALAGDAGQRVLMAWHLGWQPAIAASGEHWREPVLGQLLDDPYAAVRCIAARSMGGSSNTVPSGYDFTINPNEREPVGNKIWDRWFVRIKGHPERSDAFSSQLAKQKEAFDGLLHSRQDRPIRLRE